MAKTSSQPDTSIDWPARTDNPVRRGLALLERISLAFEKPFSRWIGRAAFNPFYHTGTITNFLLLLVLATGLYLTFFYQFGFEVSYQAVAGIERNLVGRIIRAVHVYASGAALLTALLHGWRMLFMDRFRGARWLAWVTGVGLTAMVWIAGFSGYWMVWDERAALLNQTLIRLLENTRAGAAFLVKFLFGPEVGTGWVFMVIVITVHLGVSALIGLALWYHLKRLSRPKWLPPAHWMWVIAGMLALAALVLPLGLLPPADPARLPAELPLDLWFLAYLPAAMSPRALVFWGGALLVPVLVSLVPWLLRRKPLEPVQVDPERCTGCTLCEADCPYTAIRMIPRPEDGTRHKFLAEIDPGLCVSCGVCIGSCPPLALTLGNNPPEPLWDRARAGAVEAAAEGRPLVFACERHALQGARKNEAVIPLTCIGMAHPDLAAWALDAGAPEVRFVGCPAEDCANREGNVFLAERLAGTRKPRLRLAYRDERVRGIWLAPDAYNQIDKTGPARPNGEHGSNGTDVPGSGGAGIPDVGGPGGGGGAGSGGGGGPGSEPATAYDFPFQGLGWRAYFPALLLFSLVLAGQIWFSRVPAAPAVSENAYVEVAFTHRAGAVMEGAAAMDAPAEPGFIVRLEIADTPATERRYPGGREYAVFLQTALAPGTYPLRLWIEEDGAAWVLQEGEVRLAPGEILRLSFTDTRVGGDPRGGEELYYETALGNNAACRICHSLREGEVLVGPSFYGVATRAETRVPGMSAEEYLRQSILEPNAFVVEGFPENQMPPNLGEILTEQQIDDIIAFLLTYK